MKNILQTFVLIFLFMNISCKAQQMVQTPNDVYKLRENEQQFINKPLKNLLKEIKPEIKMAAGTLSDHGDPSLFSFWFESLAETSKIVKGKKHISLYVYVKEPVEEWTHETRPKDIEFKWRKEDVEKYGNFTVTRIKVIEYIDD